ncbi:MAG TPA: phage holin family protein [Opitutaceae bacterium]|nr:phage holin family protein [Opitutaceae bacterium]
MNKESSAPTNSANSIPSLLRDLRNETTTLLQQEVALAKAEMADKISRMLGNAVQLAVGGFVAYAGGIIVLLGIADLVASLLIRAGLEPTTSTWISRALIGLIVAITGVIMLSKAKKLMSADDLVPEKTIDTMQDNKEWAEQKIQEHT